MTTPYIFSPEQKRKALIWLSFWHVVVITASNYLVQFPFSIGGFHNTWGAFTFPFIFLTTDLTSRVFGFSLARHIIFWAMLPALAVSYLVSVLFVDGVWTGSGLAHFNVFAARIALASFLAYVVGQVVDIAVFSRLRRSTRWWLAPFTSTVFGSALDTVIFFGAAFYKSSDAFMATHWPEIGLLDYVFKLFINGLFFLPLYGVLLKYLLNRLTALPPKPSDLLAS
ncbi:MAG: 7-cyano-7-deazaguanine/7-aminomethyl-7-deazaguanine transporter [Brachymonas sp.]|nr:7-cyano-7-deazaguanine/7-aminomethyl-7-deazaguanine transporter [Brachymonas sp.]